MKTLLDVSAPQPRRITEPAHGGEADSIYNAVKALRRLGHSVYRQGWQHVVDGTMLDDRQLVALAGRLEA